MIFLLELRRNFKIATDLHRLKQIFTAEEKRDAEIL